MSALAVTLYDTAVAAHVIAVTAAFGVLFAYPWLPTGTAAGHAARRRLLSVVVERGALVALLLGLYLAGDRELLGEIWVLVPLACLLLIGGVVGSAMIPLERRLEGLAGDARERSGLERRALGLALACAALVAVATFFMVTKAGA